MAGNSIEIVIGAKDNASPVIGKTRAGIESISKQLTLARNAFLAFQGAVGVSGGFAALTQVADQVRLIDARLKLATGSAAFCRSTLIKKLRQTPPDYAGACQEILRWTRAGGRELPGLKARRQAEYRQCIGEAG